MCKKIVVIGNSQKFLEILKTIYPNSITKVYSWRKLEKINFKKKNSPKKIDIIVVCGYDYKSQWYSFKKYYLVNITKPFMATKMIASPKTNIIYINTINKLKNNKLHNNLSTWSRYEFAKKELAYKLSKHFRLLKILEMPVIKKENGFANIHGGIFTLIIFNFLIYFKFIKTVEVNSIKNMFKSKMLKKKIILSRLKPVGLSIPRSHFIDRLLRMISD